MREQREILRALADGACRSVARKVRRGLQALRDAKLSGDDSCLRDAWDEFCVQLQSGESALWEAYEATVYQFIGRELRRLDENLLCAIWYQTERGTDYWLDTEYGTDSEDEAPEEPADDEVRQEVADRVYQEYLVPEAEYWENDRIRQYQSGQTEFDY